MKWPNKTEREDFEIQGFIKEYKRLRHGRSFVVEHQGENPDRTVRDVSTHEKYGIELTSIYLNDRRVPDIHMPDENVIIPFSQLEIEQYEKRILNKIIDKVCRARKHYKKDLPLILSVYVNDYISLHMGLDYWKAFALRYDILFDCFAPFEEIVFWPLPSAEKDFPLVISARIPKHGGS